MDSYNKSYIGVDDMLSRLYNNRSLLSEMYVFRKESEFTYYHALSKATEEEITALLDYGVISRDGDNLELDPIYLRFFEETMQSNEDINNATVEENLARLKKNIAYYKEDKDNPESQRRDFLKIRSCLKNIGSLVKNNINALHINIDDVYKTAERYDTKRERLGDYQKTIIDIENLIGSTRKLLEQEDSTFRIISPDGRLLHMIAELKRTLASSYNTIIHLEETIRDYIHQIDVQTELIKKIRKLKKLLDDHTLQASTDIREVLVNRNALWMEPQHRFCNIKPSLDYLINTDAGFAVIETAKSQIQVKSSTKRKEAPPLKHEDLKAKKSIEDRIKIDIIAQSFMASGKDLFNFVIDYKYETDLSVSKKLECYAAIIVKYSESLIITNDFKETDFFNYPLIYAK